MARAVRIERTGGPEVIGWADVDLPAPAPGEVRMRNTAVGLNFIDVYHRSGVYPVKLPSGLGTEAVGVVEALAEGVGGFAVGDRVGTFGPALGPMRPRGTSARPRCFTCPTTSMITPPLPCC